MPRNNLHSFTLNLPASKAVRSVPRGQKSKFVSKALTWYAHFHCTSWIDNDGNLWRTGQQIKRRFIDRRIIDFVDAHERLLDVVQEQRKIIEELEKSQSFISKIRKKMQK